MARSLLYLENRRLLSGVTVAGNPTDLFNVAGPFTSVTAAPVGSDGNSLVQYLDGTSGSGPVTLREAIISADMSVVTGPTAVNTGGLSLDPFGKLASVTDSNGNVAEMIPVASASFTTIWYLDRFDPAGNPLGMPSLVGDTLTGSPLLPAMAAGPDGEIGVVFSAAGPDSIVGQVFDANDSPLTSWMPLSPPAPATGSTNWLATRVAFDPVSNQFLAVATSQSLSATFQSTGETLGSCTFNAAGVAGTPNTIDQELATSTSDNAIRLAGVWGSSTGNPWVLYSDDQYSKPSSTGANFNFIGTSLRDQQLTPQTLSWLRAIIIIVDRGNQLFHFPAGLRGGPRVSRCWALPASGREAGFSPAACRRSRLMGTPARSW